MYQGIIGDMLMSLLGLTGLVPASLLTRMNCIVGATASVMLPLSLPSDLSFLSFTSLLGAVAVLYTSVFVGLRAVDGSYAVGGALAAAAPVAPAFLNAPTWACSAKAFVLVSNLGLSFVAHYNAPRYFNELEENTEARWGALVRSSFGILSIVYAFTMLCGHATFGDSSKSNILLNYAENDVLAIGARVASAVSILFGFPLCSCGMIDSLQSVARSKGLGAVGGSSARPVVAALLIAATMVLSIIFVDIGLVVGIAGALIGSFLVYIAPPVISLLAQKGLPPAEKFGKAEMYVVHLLPILGVALAALGVTMTCKEYLG